MSARPGFKGSWLFAIFLLPFLAPVPALSAQETQVKTECPGLYDQLFPDYLKTERLPAVLSQSVNQLRAAPDLALPAAGVIGMERRIVNDLVFNTNLLLPKPSFGFHWTSKAERSRQLQMEIARFVAAYEAPPAVYLKNLQKLVLDEQRAHSLEEISILKFAKERKISRGTAQKVIERLIEVRDHPEEAAVAWEKIRAKVALNYGEQISLAEQKAAHPKLIDDHYAAVAVGGPVWSFLGSAYLATHMIGPGMEGVPFVIGSVLTYGAFLAHQILHRPYDAKINGLVKIMQAELSKGIRDRELDVTLEREWEKWRSSIRQTYHQTQDRESSMLEFNSERLFSTTVLLSHIRNIEMPNGGRLADYAGHADVLNPEIAAEMKEGVLRKHRQLDLIAEELARIAVDAKSAVQGSRENLERLMLLEQSDLNESNVEAIQRFLDRLPLSYRTEVAQVWIAHQLSLKVEAAREYLRNMEMVLENGVLNEPEEKVRLMERIQKARVGFQKIF